MSAELRDEIAKVLNRHSRENRSDTPDFLLAEYVLDSLDAFDRVTRMRETWYGRGDGGGIPMEVAADVGVPALQLVHNEPLQLQDRLDPPIPVGQLQWIAKVRGEEGPDDDEVYICGRCGAWEKNGETFPICPDCNLPWTSKGPRPEQDRTPERHFDWDDDTSLGTALGEAIGLASMCWSEIPSGVFDSDRASDIVNELLWFLTKRDDETGDPDGPH